MNYWKEFGRYRLTQITFALSGNQNAALRNIIYSVLYLSIKKSE